MKSITTECGQRVWKLPMQDSDNLMGTIVARAGGEAFVLWERANMPAWVPFECLTAVPGRVKMAFEFDKKPSWWQWIVISELAGHPCPDRYEEVFVKMLGSVYTNLRVGKNGSFDGVRYQAFTFGQTSDLDWTEDVPTWLSEIARENQHILEGAQHTHYQFGGNTLVVIKKDNANCWTAASAIYNADEVLSHMVEMGF